MVFLQLTQATIPSILINKSRIVLYLSRNVCCNKEMQRERFADRFFNANAS